MLLWVLLVNILDIYAIVQDPIIASYPGLHAGGGGEAEEKAWYTLFVHALRRLK